MQTSKSQCDNSNYGAALSKLFSESHYSPHFRIAFIVNFVLSILFMALFLVNCSKSDSGDGVVSAYSTPIMKSQYETTYGEGIDSSHVTLFGMTNILRQANSKDYMPLAPLPLSFYDTGAPTDMTYASCLTFDYSIYATNLEKTRYKNLCVTEKVKQVAFYTNDARSLTFSSAWNPLFMGMVVFWLYTSWFLLLSTVGTNYQTIKFTIYIIWQLFISGVVVISAILQVNNSVVPRNNVLFAVVVILITVGQQLYTLWKCYCCVDKTKKVGVFDLCSCIRNSYHTHPFNPDDNYSYVNYKINEILLNMNVILFPTLVACMYALSNSYPSEWSFQATFVRVVVTFAGLMLVHHRKINPIYIKLRNVEKYTGNYVNGFIQSLSTDSIIVLVALLLLSISELYITYTRFEGSMSGGLTNMQSLVTFIVLIIVIISELLSSYIGKTDHKTQVYFRHYVLYLSQLLFGILILYSVGMRLNEFYCTTHLYGNHFCGNTQAAKNLNLESRLSPVMVSSSDFATVYAALEPSLTYSL